MTTPKPPLSIESAIALASAPLGGVTNASLALGRDRYTVAHASNTGKPDMLRLDDAIKLDMLCMDAGGGTPILEHFKAALAPEDGPRTSYHSHMASIVRDSADVIEVMARSLSDNELSPSEKDSLKRELESLRVALGRLESDLESG